MVVMYPRWRIIPILELARKVIDMTKAMKKKEYLPEENNYY